MLEAAKRRYMEGLPIDIVSLAAEHKLSRATAYRWLGDNDRLLAEILLDRTVASFQQAEKAHARKTGRQRILAILRDFLQHAAESKRFHALLQHDPKRALTLIASRAHPNQKAVVNLFQKLLEEEVRRGTIKLNFEIHSLAYVMVRISEAFLYADVVAGEEPNPANAVEIIGGLLPDGSGSVRPTKTAAGIRLDQKSARAAATKATPAPRRKRKRSLRSVK